MKGKTAALLVSGLLAACAQPPSPEATAPPAPAAAAPAQPPASAPAAPAAPAAAAPPTNHIVSIRGAGCQDLLKLSPEDRSAASMFYIGYQASRLRASTINVGTIPSIEAQAVTYCEQNPNRTVADVFAEAFVRSRK